MVVEVYARAVFLRYNEYSGVEHKLIPESVFVCQIKLKHQLN